MTSNILGEQNPRMSTDSVKATEEKLWVDIPSQILSAQEQGKLVVFAGAGVSMGEPSCLPSFLGLCKQIARGHRLSVKLDGVQTPPLEHFLSELSHGGVSVQDLCRDAIKVPNSKPKSLHRSILELFSKPEELRIVTTNFDTHFETVLNSLNWHYDCYNAPALPLGNDFTGIVHLHGSVGRKEPLVLTAEDFGRAYLTEGWAREFLHRLFAEFSTLFIGYSHKDLPIDFLARGMTGKSIAPRFALSVDDPSDDWKTLGITEISIPPSKHDRYAGLDETVKVWAEFMGQQPVEIAERIKNIVRAYPSLAPDKAQTSLIRRCLSRDDSVHFFTTTARGCWPWVMWLDAQGFLARYFTKITPANTSIPYHFLCDWLAGELLACENNDALLFVAKYNGVVGTVLKMCLARRIDRSTDDELSNEKFSKWMTIVLQDNADDDLNELSFLLPRFAKVAPATLGLTLFQRLTALRPVWVKRSDFSPLVRGESFESLPEKPELELHLVGEDFNLTEAWKNVFLPKISELGEDLTMILEIRLKEAYRLYAAAKMSTEFSDPLSYKGEIESRGFTSDSRPHGLVNWLLDIIETFPDENTPISKHRITGWLISKQPTLARLGLYALRRSELFNANQKITLLLNNDLIFPKVQSGLSEVASLLNKEYSLLNDTKRLEVWSVIERGPQFKPPEHFSEVDWKEHREFLADWLIDKVARHNRNCPHAMQALDRLCLRNSKYTASQDENISSNLTANTFERPSPKSLAELLSSSPEEQCDYLLSFSEGEDFKQPSRNALLNTVGSACHERSEWGIGLVKSLVKRSAWNSDILERALWNMRFDQWPGDSIKWFLEDVQKNAKKLDNLYAIALFLFTRVNPWDASNPTTQHIETLQKLSLQFWEIQSACKIGLREQFQKDWYNLAINDAVGPICEFWLQLCSYLLEKKVEQNFPTWLQGPLAEIESGASYTAQLGRAVFCRYLSDTYEIDPTWTRTHLFPKLRFSIVGEEAWIAWNSHLPYGSLSRKLILTMPGLYRDAYGPLREAPITLQNSFANHMALVMFYGAGLGAEVDTSWLGEFLSPLDDQRRADWVRHLTRCLHGADQNQKTAAWSGWLKTYWANRTAGTPCTIEPKEASAMSDWATELFPFLQEVMPLLKKIPSASPHVSFVIEKLITHQPPVELPEQILELLIWLLANTKEAPSSSIETIIFRLPHKRRHLKSLMTICNNLTTLRYPTASELTSKIKSTFEED